MLPRSRLREVGRSALAQVPGRWRARALALAARGTGMPGADVGLVSVVVVHEPGDRMNEALASVRAQTHPLLDVLICPVGSATAALPDDPRFRARAPAATSYAAVNGGVASATGRYVVLLRGCDRLLPSAVAELTGCLSRSGADVASGLLEQVGEAELWLRHAQADRADPVADLGLANKAFTRDLARSLRLTETDDWLCSPTLAHLLPTLTVEVIGRPVARFAHDRGRRAYGARPSPLPELDHWLRLRDLVTAALGGSLLAESWTRHWYDVLAPRFVADAERADDATWSRLVELSAVPQGVDLRASARSLLALAHDGRRTDVEALAAELELLGDDVPTELDESGPVATWSSVTLAPEHRRLGERESRLRTRVVRVAETTAGRRVDLWVHVDGVDQATTPFEIQVDAGGTPLQVERTVDRAAERWAAARFQSAAPGAVRVLAPPGSSRLTVTTAGPIRRTATVELPTPRPAARGTTSSVLAIELDGEQVVVRLDGPADELRLRGPGTDVLGVQRPDGSVAFDTDRDLYGRRVNLATAVYRLERHGGLGAGRGWLEQLPVEVVGDVHRLRVLPDGDGPGELHLGPPRADDELGPYGQERLRASYAVDERPTGPDLWYVESFAGRSATDTPLAVYGEVHARRPDLTLAWGVLDRGHWTPPGSRPVVIGSREWYDVLGTARVLVTNTELEEWYRRRPDQLVVQCFHGYPSKAMGESQWRARELPPRRLALMRRRSVETWDLISTPTPEMTEVYREQYGYGGEAAEQGYPRNDALTAPDADRVRDAARRRLGVRADQTAVLYAPTWRDHLATRPRAAALADHLDVDAAAAALGDSHVVLLRGHRFHASSGSRRGVVDVTDHPEINDLILASDVAVLDYSSLRFDYALTGKPMVFLVPDLEDYTSGVRGFLFPFTDSAPGPLVETTDQVVSHVRDAERLATACAGRLADFNSRYNPWQDGLATARFVDLLEARLGSADAGAGPEVR
jgi:CDP-glycerol glycerophosphotransferase (TagB/SpsB family)